MNTKNLIICPITANSEHKYWLEGASPDFDLCLISCDGIAGECFRKDARYFYLSEGLFKLENIAAAIEYLGGSINHYDTLWLPDEDIRTDAAEINEFFRLFLDLNLDAGQPALRKDRGTSSHKVALQNERSVVRYGVFVDIMMPAFRRDVFVQAILPTLKLNRSGWGIDFVWATLLVGKRVGIIDAVAMYHKWRVQPFEHCNQTDGLYYQRLRALGINAAQECSVLAESLNK